MPYFLLRKGGLLVCLKNQYSKSIFFNQSAHTLTTCHVTVGNIHQAISLMICIHNNKIFFTYIFLSWIKIKVLYLFCIKRLYVFICAFKISLPHFQNLLHCSINCMHLVSSNRFDEPMVIL